MATRVLTLVLFVLLAAMSPASSLYEDQVGLTDWYRQYIGKVKDAVFHTQKSGRKRVFVSTEENVVASLDLRHGEIIWRRILGNNDSIDAIDIAMGKFLITLSSGGTILRAWNLYNGQMVWESHMHEPRQSNALLFIFATSTFEKGTVILVASKLCLNVFSGVNGEVLWKKDFASESFQIHQVIQPLGSDIINVVGLSGLSQFSVYKIKLNNGEQVKYQKEKLSSEISGEVSVVSGRTVVAVGSSGSTILTINIQEEKILCHETSLSDLIKDFSGKGVILPSKLDSIFAMEASGQLLFIRATEESRLEVIDEFSHSTAYSDALLFSESEQAVALVQYLGGDIQFKVKNTKNWDSHLLEEKIKMDHQRGHVHRVFVNNYVRTDRSHGFRALIVMEDHSVLLLQQGEIVWSREDGLASIVDVVVSELPVEKGSVSVAKVEHNIYEWLKGHMLKLKGTLMLASSEDIVAIQELRMKNSEKNKMTRDHNGFRKLFIVLAKSGKVFALHSGDGRVVWTLTPTSLHKSKSCEHPTGLNLYQWQVPHHHALDQNPSVLVIGTCYPNSDSPSLLSFVDTYTGRELSSLPAPPVMHVIPLPFTDSTEQRLHLLIDNTQRAHLYPRTAEALGIFHHELENTYWYSVNVDNGIIKGHSLTKNCPGEFVDEYCFGTRPVWSIVFPSDSERIIKTANTKLNEVVHTQAKVLSDQDVMYKYMSKNLLFVATVSPSAIGHIGSSTPDQVALVVYVLDTITGRILHRMTHSGSQGPVHAVLSENYVIYHYFNLRAHRYEMSVVEIYDQSRADNRDILKLVLGQHNLTSSTSSYMRPEVFTKFQSYYFPHSVKTLSISSTAKGITSKHLLIGTTNDQVLAIDKRYLDPRRTANPTQAELEEGISPLTDSLPINPQFYITHALKVGGLRGIVTSPAKLESTTLVFAYGVDHFFIRHAPSRTYDSLTEDFNYALLLLTIVALVAAIAVTWVLSERKDLRDNWR